MTRIAERTVLFADLRGSTALFENLGNAQATALVTQCIGIIGARVEANGGTVVKTLGDGLMAAFDQPLHALRCALRMQEALDTQITQRSGKTMPAAARSVRLQVAVATGEVVEMGGDCFGDAVNVAARLLDHAGDSEVLVTQQVFDTLPPIEQARFRHLDGIVLRGRAEPVSVHVAGGRRGAESAATAFSDMPQAHDPDGVRLTWIDVERVFESPQMPLVIGRSPQATFCVSDSRVSRSHARIDWHSGSFQLTDLSFNGTSVRFADGEIVNLRRGSCTLHGHGSIGLGGSPADIATAVVRFEVIRFGDTQP